MAGTPLVTDATQQTSGRKNAKSGPVQDTELVLLCTIFCATTCSPGSQSRDIHVQLDLTARGVCTRSTHSRDCEPRARFWLRLNGRWKEVTTSVVNLAADGWEVLALSICCVHSQ
ncbi:hypothetical protein BaRGS_00020949 [Batillaria attramentaria]|uniref:Uncharacterized protein n=1 Tax=Batillaria attramentaria TaxID=370345 RepID=A0ABD0KKR0_9CAEN